MTSLEFSKANLEQTKVIQGLLNPDCYPHEVGQIVEPGKSVDLIETHISTVLLAGAYAYKIKKPVDFGFLDFTSLKLRRFYCEEELRLNRRLAPRLYLDVVAIVGSPDAPRIGPFDAPEPIEYAVKMRRFAQSKLLDRMLTSGELTPHHLDLLAETMADFHRRIERVSDANGEDVYGTPASIAAPMRQNFTQIRPLLESGEDISELDFLENWSNAAHTVLTTFMVERLHAGYVRECHGDLHLGNIAWVDDEIQIFDCIEFNPVLRWIDVASEIAFTVMDLAARGRPEWGARLLNAYLEATGDYASLYLLPYYLVYRAMVRAKVACIRSTQTDGDARRMMRSDYANHIWLARSYTAQRRAVLLITHGVSGTGKTTATQVLVEHLGAVRLRSDVERKRLRRLSRHAESGSALGSGLYAETSSKATYAELRRLAEQTIDAGYPVIVDATFLSHSQRAAIHSLAIRLKVPFLILDCRASGAELRQRVAKRQAEGRDASEADLAVLERQLQVAEPLDSTELKSAIIIDTQRDMQSDIVARVRQRLDQSGVTI